jgi:hypothetical protein
MLGDGKEGCTSIVSKYSRTLVSETSTTIEIAETFGWFHPEKVTGIEIVSPGHAVVEPIVSVQTEA